MSARQTIAAALAAAVPGEEYLVVDDVRELGELPRKALQLFRNTIAPAANVLGGFDETLELWLVDPHLDPAIVENALDESLDEVLLIVSELRVDGRLVAKWTKATRDTHRDGYHGYRIELETKSKRKA